MDKRHSRIGRRAPALAGLAGAIALLGGAPPALAGVTWLQKLVAADAAPQDHFGRSVALRGEILAIGAPLDDDGATQAGSVYLYESGTPAWTLVTKLAASDPRDHQLLGLADIDLVDGRLVAGAPGDGATALQAGAAYVFEDSGMGWYEAAKLTASDGAAFDAFGWAVALDGTTAAVSAYLADGAYTDSGAVYVFEEEPGGWVERAKLTASDAFASDLFGYRLDLEGDQLVVGAPWDDDRGSRSGSVYLFQRTGGVWSQTGKLAPSALRAGDQFGHDVSLDGERLAVGAAYTDTLEQDAGVAYVLARQAGTWAIEARLEAGEPGAFDAFGSRVALDGRALVVTSQLDDHEQGVDAGSATVFLSCNGTWREESRLQAFDGGAADLYATDVALDGGLALIGAAQDDEPSDDEGSAYLYRASVPVGTSYCTAVANSTGSGATICALGSTRVADADLTLLAEGLPGGVPGLRYFGPGQVEVPFGDGMRCVGGGPFYRIWPFVHADGDGRMTRAIDWSSAYATHIAPGVTMNFQLWYRDLAGGGAGYNLTDGVEIAFE